MLPSMRSDLPMRFAITLGHWGDCPQARGLQEGMEGIGHGIADAGYDADHLRDVIANDLGARTQIKQSPTHSSTKLIDLALYRGRKLAERFINRIKRFRRIVLCCEKTVASFHAFVSLTCAMAWLVSMKTPPNPDLPPCGTGWPEAMVAHLARQDLQGD